MNIMKKIVWTAIKFIDNGIKLTIELKKTIDALHANESKALLTMNIFPRNQDINIFESTVEQIASM